MIHRQDQNAVKIARAIEKGFAHLSHLSKTHDMGIMNAPSRGRREFPGR